MRKKRKIDYIIKDTNDYRIIFRFYPRRSSCHSFNAELPKSWNDVYKVYYHYRILKFWKDEDGNCNEHYVLYNSGCDECSAIDQIGQICLSLSDGYETFEREDGELVPFLDRPILPFGMGTEWFISKHVCTTYGWDEEEDVIDVYYTFMLFDWCGKGFKFTLKNNKVQGFGEYLLGCCEYMLTHGDTI